ncbi:hypothetical protein SNEBB_009580 [Seison nebaliae]|nr:hypothetical protein SNEBB_009580 [Seison nebaliae]
MLDFLERKNEQSSDLVALDRINQHHYWSPYSFHGGTVLGIAGDDFALIASDTRLSEYYSIHNRNCPHVYKMTKETLLGCVGFHGDVLALTKQLEARHQIYESLHHHPMKVHATAAMLSTMLYSRRFFPYYTYNILAGIDKDGKGAIYSYDPVGSYEREEYRAAGSSSSLLQPLLDNQIGMKNQIGEEKKPISIEKGLALIKDVFVSATERDIHTGDSLLINIITKDGMKQEKMDLRKD